VGRVRAENQGFMAEFGTTESGGGGYRGFTNASFASHQDYAHGYSYLPENLLHILTFFNFNCFLLETLDFSISGRMSKSEKSRLGEAQRNPTAK
jgi:hypothetical protein